MKEETKGKKIWAIVENGYTLRKGFVFYGAYHSDWRNQLVHIFFVPTIFTSVLSFLARVQITSSIDLSQIAAGVYAISFIKMEPGAGIPYAAVIAFMQYIASHHLKQRPKLSLAINVTGWIIQFISHAFFEKRSPALLDDPFQALHSSVFFVWLEVLFYFGYKPELKKELDMLISKKKVEIAEKKGETIGKKETLVVHGNGV
ncbi:uncharacterized protein TM35_000042200 [Trypanosoma theileri]|uniref:DUF962-domain-containing protein n=1 Tax=Trypanosoma theileri TaxID=67003 RepID=A0A1X0P4Z2_9TRYP|nr:uncharacterized protein TM35_000042200 [Trypanosoma theileri]ORC92006.1 hypothetical protein TM35_000042200 [Trypanosoma theileri]